MENGYCVNCGHTSFDVAGGECSDCGWTDGPNVTGCVALFGLACLGGAVIFLFFAAAYR